MRRRGAFLDLLRQPESVAGKFFARGPHALLDALLPVVIHHNLQRAEVRAALRAELDAALAELSTQTVGELLDELGLRELTRAALREHTLPLAVAFVASPEFARFRKPG